MLGKPASFIGRVASETNTPSIVSEYKKAGVAHLTISIDYPDFTRPQPGQFYLVKSAASSKVLLGRPLSVYRHRSNFLIDHSLEFLIVEKGSGTKELCELCPGDEVELIGPLGNGFTINEQARICLIGGGVGIAPISYLATRLPDFSYDLYACFKDVPYGISELHPRVSHLASESGFVRAKTGMLDAVFTAETIREQCYDIVYACGPSPMLDYVNQLCQAAGIKAWLSLEKPMACGVGACLGCSISTSQGNKRICKDGPIFPGDILPKLSSSSPKQASDSPVSPDLSVEIAGIKFSNPVIAASGTFGYGTDYSSLVDVTKLGGICSKGLTLSPRSGNDGTRIYEIKGFGLLNSIGLENPGIEHFIADELPRMRDFGVPVIANLSGSTADDYLRGAALLDQSAVDAIELNISCPNVKAGGMAFGTDPGSAHFIVECVKDVTSKPIIVKLTPNVTRIGEVALSVQDAGADAISLVNTFQGMAINLDTGKPVFENTYAGYSGPAIMPLALRCVHQVAQTLKRHDIEVPIIGLGGITTWQDAVQFLLAGATAIQVGTATFSNPTAMVEIIEGIKKYMCDKGFRTITELHDFSQC